MKLLCLNDVKKGNIYINNNENDDVDLINNLTISNIGKKLKCQVQKSTSSQST